MSSIKGTSGFVLDAKQIAIVEKYNEAVRQGTYQHSQLTTIVGNNNKELKAYLRSLNGAIAETKQFHNVTLLGATGLKGLGTALKSVGATIKSTMIQFGAIFLANEIISWTIKGLTALWNIIPTKNHVRDWAEEAAASLKETQDELSSLKDKLTDVKDRITELQNKGPLTITEKSELEQLRLENAELEKRIALLREEEKIKKGDTIESNVEAVHSYDYQISKRVGQGTATPYNQALTLPEQFEYYTELYNKYKKLVQDTPAKDPQFQTYVEFVDEYKEKITQLSLELDKYRVNIEDVDKSEQEYFKNLYAAENKGLLSTGVLSVNDFIKSSVTETEFKKYQQLMQDLAESGITAPKQIEKAFKQSIPNILPVLNSLGFGVDDLVEEIQSIRGIEGILSNIFDTGQFKDVQSVIDEITSNKEFNITADNIKGIIESIGNEGTKFIQTLEDNNISIDKFVFYLQMMQNNIEKISVKSTIEELSTIESNLKSLSDAYAEFRDNNGKVSASTLDGLAETFAAISDTAAFENLINVLGNAKSSISDVKAAMDDMVDVYFNQTEVLANLNDENKALIVNQLRQMGVVNASALVEYKLARATLENANATEEAKSKARQFIVGLENESLALNETAAASLDAAQKLQILNVYKDYVASGNFAEVVQSHAKAIMSVGLAAGKSAKNLVEYSEIMDQITSLQQRLESGKGHSSITQTIANLKDRAKSLETTAESEFNSLFDFDVKYKPSNSSKSSGDKKTKADIYNEKKKELDNQLERNLISYNDYYNKLVKLGNKYLKKDKDARAEHFATLADVRKNAYDKYQGNLDKQLENGDISLKIYYDKSQKLMNKWLKGRKSNAEDLADAITAIGDKVNDHWNDIISKTETRIDRWNIDQTWAPGMDEAKVWEEKLQELNADYIAGLFDSTDEYYDLYYEILKKKNDALKDQLESQLDDLENRADNIQDLIDMVDEMLRKRIEEQIDLLEKQKDAYSDIVAKKKESLDLSRKELEYSRELEEKNKSLAELQAQAAVLALDDSRAGRAQYAKLLEEIKSKQTEIADFQADYTYEATTGALDDADEHYQKSIQDKIDDLNAMTENQGKWLEYVYSYIKTTNPSALFKQLYDYNFQYGTGMNSTVDDIKKASMGLLTQYQSDIPKILAAIESQKVEINQAIGNIGQDESVDKSANYDSDLLSKIQVSKTKQNTHAQNMELLTQVRDLYGSGWYDSKKKIIYVGSDGDRSETAGAYELIKQMSTINQQSLSKSEKQKQLEPLLKKLQGKYSYSQSYLTWSGNTAHLYKKNPATKPIQVFHTGIQQGFVSDGKTLNVSSQQRELLALLQSGELVFNKNDQERLMVQMSTLKNLTDTLKRFDSTASGLSNSVPPIIQLSIETPITINGNVDDETMKKLEGLSDDIANKSLSLLQSAYEKRGYGSRVKANSMRK